MPISPRLPVIGIGYLGTTHATYMTELGHEALGVEVGEIKVEALNYSRVSFYKPGLPDVLERNIDEGRHGFTTDYAEAVALSQCALHRGGHPAVARLAHRQYSFRRSSHRLGTRGTRQPHRP